MKKAKICIISIVMASLLTGCAMFGPNEGQALTASEAYKAFINQQRTSQILIAEGTPENPAEITLRGTNVTMSMPLNPLSALGKDDSKRALYQAVENMFRAGAVVYGIDKLAPEIGDTYNGLE